MPKCLVDAELFKPARGIFACAAYNFDHPSAFDSKAIVKCLKSLQHMQQVDVPTYDFISHQRSSATRRVEPADVVIIEGIMVLHVAEVREMLNMKIYVDTDDDVRLARRLVSCQIPPLN